MSIKSIAAALLMSVTTSMSLAAPDKTTRTVVLEKIDTGGYRWKITRAAVPEVNDRQVLVRVRAVALNRLDLDELAPSTGPDKSGRVPGYDAAGDVVAVGKQVKDFRPGMRVTSQYFENWVDGRFNAKMLERVRGWTIDGVLGDYVVFEETSLAPMPGAALVRRSRHVTDGRPHRLECRHRRPPVESRMTSCSCREQAASPRSPCSLRRPWARMSS